MNREQTTGVIYLMVILLLNAYRSDSVNNTVNKNLKKIEWQCTIISECIPSDCILKSGDYCLSASVDLINYFCFF